MNKTCFIILGATGDLTAKKIIPSLFHLYSKNKLPRNFNIIAFARRELTSANFRVYSREVLKKHKEIPFDERKAKAFLNLITYHQGHFEHVEDFKKLSADLKNQSILNKLIYLAVPPKYYEELFKNLKASKITQTNGGGWTRILVEKPFGSDFAGAQRLDSMLGKLFKEEQIYRIDHYLAKEMIQNILIFRFTNNIFEQSWSNKYIEKIEIRLLEEMTAEGRGSFYDGVGALRDVGQNHLLQMLAVVTMENPGSFDSDAIRTKRAQILKYLVIPSKKDIQENSIRAQYAGYKNVEGVAKNSNMETYFKFMGYLTHPKWSGVPVIFESGKAMPQQIKDITVTFKHPVPCVCPKGIHDSKNKVVFSLEPREEIRVDLYSKLPGYSRDVVQRIFPMPYRTRSGKSQYTEEYERLLMDAVIGDQTLFVSTDEVLSMWKFTDPVVNAWDKNLVSLTPYKPGSEEIFESSNEFKADSISPKKEIAIVGLGKMGANLGLQLVEKGWKVFGFNRTAEVTGDLEKEGLTGVYLLNDLRKMSKPRIVWLMLPAGDATREYVISLSKILNKGDIVIDGGNSFFKQSIKNAAILSARGINFVDAGVSGGPAGARNGACLMVGGDKKIYEYLLPLFIDISVSGGHEFFAGVGAGHFVKMVHNAIEYGMMQSIAEGFDVMKHSKYKLHLKGIAQIYNYGSVVESRLIGWMKDAFDLFGDDLKQVSGSAGGGGAGAGTLGKEKSEAVWTVEVAKKLKIPVPVINDAVGVREKTQANPSYQGKVINALRNRFGGHGI